MPQDVWILVGRGVGGCFFFVAVVKHDNVNAGAGVAAKAVACSATRPRQASACWPSPGSSNSSPRRMCGRESGERRVV